jgi:hypothetical protein
MALALLDVSDVTSASNYEIGATSANNFEIACQ